MIMPTGDNVIIKIKKQESVETTKSGILLTTKNKEKEEIGEVVAVGSGRILNDGTKIPMQVSKGNKIIYNKFAGTELNFENELYLIIKENDILAIIE